MSGKRKRLEQPELEVDVNAPEPPSKKALRRAKKGKPVEAKKDDSDRGSSPEPKVLNSKADVDASRRNAPGIWIGNLPWTVSKTDLLQFLTEKSDGSIAPGNITRVNLPGPTAAALGAPGAKHKKPLNRGFAYVDFDSTTARDAAIALSENLISGRAVLIKDSKSFAGRPDPVVKEQETSGKPPSTKIFVGNLGFETTEEELSEHFSKCGQVKNAFMAKFHDTNKCKGYAWITFNELVSAEKAMRGWVELEPEIEDHEEEEEDNKAQNQDKDEGEQENGTKGKTETSAKSRRRKKPKPRKWYINRLKGRDLRMEYAEDPTTRYNKRFGKGRPKESSNSTGAEDTAPVEENSRRGFNSDRSRNNEVTERKAGEEIRPSRSTGLGTSTAKPTPSKDKAYLTGAVMEGKGKKTTFD